MTRLLAASTAFAVFAILAGCGDSSTSLTPAPAIATAPTTAPTTPTAVSVSSTPAGSPTAPPASATASTSPTTDAAAPTMPATTAPPPTAPAPPPSAQTIAITAHDIAFDRAEIHVRVGTKVTAIFQNTDAGIDHNLTFSLPGLEHPTCTGPCTTTQTFTASTAGKFAFFCTIHAQMFGDFYIDA